MDAVVFLLIVFAVITIVLLKTKHERHFLFFMIRTQYGLRLINFLAKVRPGFWKFVGDLGVVVSFCGLGAFYLSKNRESRRNLYVIMALAMLLGVFVSDINVIVKLVSLALLAVALKVMKEINNAVVNFIVTSLLISLIAGAFISKLHFVLLLGFFGFPALIIMALIQQAYEIFQGSTLPGISPLLPSTREGRIGVGFPGYDIFIPWWYALIAIIATLVPHELAHGILSRVHHVKVKSTGLLSFGALPLGAFVEPDEASLKSKASVSKTRVYAVGSLANFAVGIGSIILFILFTATLSQITYSEGVQIIGFDRGYPAERVLDKGLVIEQLNNHTLSGLESFENAAKELKPRENVTLKTSQGVFTFEVVESPVNEEKGYMGVLVRENVKLRYGIPSWLITPTLLNAIVDSLTWIIFFNINIGLVNLLPIPPFDGFRILNEIVKATKMKKENMKWVIYGIILVTAIVFVLNMFPLIKMALNPVLNYFGF